MTDSGFSWNVGDGGMVLGGVFWSDMSKESPIDELLNKMRGGEDVPLERFLGEQTLLQEVTAPNTELLSYLIEHLEEIIDYITLGRKRKEEDLTIQHPHSNEHYAYMCCEVLSSNSTTLNNAILKSEHLLERLFQILDEPAPLSPRSTGYFHMILLMLCQKDPNTILSFVSREQPQPMPLASPEPEGKLQSPVKELSSTEAAPATTAAVRTDPPVKDEEERGSKRRLEESNTQPHAKRAPGAPLPEFFDPFGSDPSQEKEKEVESKLSFSDPVPNLHQSLGMVPKFLKHVDSYSIACAFMVLLQAAANQLESSQENNVQKSIFHEQITPTKNDSPELIRARRLWTGGYGCAAAVLSALRERSDPYSHSNAADLLVELFRRAASARRMYLETKQMASLHVMDDEQQAPFAMNEDDLKELGEASGALALSASSSGSSEESWTVPLVDELCDLIASADELTSATDSATRVLSGMVMAYTQPFSGNDSVMTKQESCPEIEKIVRRIPELIARLTPAEGEQVFLQTQWGGRVARLGMGRLLLVELLSNLITCGFKSVAQEMAYMEPDPVTALLDLFFKFEWNNVLHSIVERTVKAILLGETNTVRAIRALPEKDAQEKEANNAKAEQEREATLQALMPLQKALFMSSPNLIARILDAYDSNAAAVRVVEERYVQTSTGGTVKADEGPRHGQKGYMGHLRNIANACAELIEAQNERGGPAFDALGEDTALKQRWYDFVNGKLSETNQIVSKPLGGAPVKKNAMVMNGFDSFGGLLTNPFGSEDPFRGKRMSVDLEEDNLDDDDDEDEDEDDTEEAIMERYNRRKEAMLAERAREEQANAISTQASGASLFVASSPQDSSWVVDDFAADFNENGSGDGPMFGSPSAYERGFFDPLANLEDSANSPNATNTDKGDADIDDFDPFGLVQEKKASPTTSASMPIAKKPAAQATTQQDEFGITPPGFEVIDKM